MSERLTQAAFARHIGVHRSHVTRLRQAGRLAMDGKHVLVDASIARIAQTAGNRDDVVARHAEARGRPVPAPAGGAGATIAAPDSPQPQPEAKIAPAAPDSIPADLLAAAGEPGIITLSALDQAREAKILAESRRVQALANREELELARARGEVIAREECEIAFRSVGAAIRGLVEQLPDQVAPLVAPAGTIDECHSILAQAGRDLLVRFAETCERQRDALKGGQA